MKRRVFLFAMTAAAVVPAFAQPKPMKIGVIGSGKIGSTLGGLWVKAGHEVMFSDRDAETAKRVASELGSRARTGRRRTSGCTAKDARSSCSTAGGSTVTRTAPRSRALHARDSASSRRRRTSP